MTIRLTPELEQLVQDRAAEHGLDAEGFVSQVLQAALESDQSPLGPASRKRRPISERFEQIRQGAPDEVRQALEELPEDFAAEHDHSLYGVAKAGPTSSIASPIASRWRS